MPELGHVRIGTKLKLKNDTSSAAYLYQLKRVWVEDALSEDELNTK